MSNKIGSIVAIEPSSGEVLAMISAPNYDPSLLTGKFFSKQFKILKQNDSLKPLINRPVYNDKYRPGSIFKSNYRCRSKKRGSINRFNTNSI